MNVNIRLRALKEMQQGFIRFRQIVYMALVLCIGYVAFVEIRKFKLDSEVRALCTKDGGLKVFERVTLSAAEYDKRGNVTIPEKSEAKPESLYYYQWQIEYIRRGNPEIYRDQYRIYRRLDGKLLGESIGYVRRGGDFPSPLSDSSYRCPVVDSDISLEKVIFGRT